MAKKNLSLCIFQNIAIFCMFSKLMRKDFAAKPYFDRQRNGFVAKRPVTHAVVTTVAQITNAMILTQLNSASLHPQ